MRINNNLMADHVFNNLSDTMNRVYDLQNQLSSGKKFDKPSDNPVEINRTMRFKDKIRQDEQYKKNLENLKPILEQTDSVMFKITDRLNQAKVLVQQYVNGSQTQETRDLMASNMQEIINSLIELGNTEYGDKYLFGGFNVSESPYVLEGDVVRFRGTDDELKTDVSENDEIITSIPGDDLFVTHQILGNGEFTFKDSLVSPEPTSNQFTINVEGNPPVLITVGASTANITAQNVVDAINSSGVEAKAYFKQSNNGYKIKIVSNFVGRDGKITLTDSAAGGILNKIGMVDTTNVIVGQESDYTAGVIDTLLNLKEKISTGDLDVGNEGDYLETGQNSVLMVHGEVGVMVQNIENRHRIMEDMSIELQSLLSSVEDIDYAEVMTEFNKEMMSYQAALQSGARVVMPSILDYLR